MPNAFICLEPYTFVEPVQQVRRALFGQQEEAIVVSSPVAEVNNAHNRSVIIKY